MSESKKVIPKPTIRTTPPVKPPQSPLDRVEPEEKKIEEVGEVIPEVVEAETEEALSSDGVETDLVKRGLGLLIDFLIAGFIGGFLGLITGSDLLQYVALGVVMLLRESVPFLDGQSVGKKVMKIRAVKEDGASLSGDWVTGAIRNLLFFSPVTAVIECFIMLSRSGNVEAGKRLGDDWAKTKVIAVD